MDGEKTDVQAFELTSEISTVQFTKLLLGTPLTSLPPTSMRTDEPNVIVGRLFDIGSSSASTNYGGVQKLEYVTDAEFNAYVLRHRSGTQHVRLYPLKQV
ncbi:hypothetical protein HID58_007506 [Brassica napus]|uniref:Uncharacterized protein n=1 Tax=Brassica napus TaxID=3708 RepID=A0ABQ8EHE5_BRANA|nr:hypothetical protein HID58_007506 [Brassica napus]